MLKRVLIANRGEIALRIIRALREMDVESVVVYSSADRESLPVMMATQSVCIGPAKASESYLNMDAILEAAIKTGCDAIHPGYGFLSENAEFAEKCRKQGLVFIGPDPEIIRQMGDKQTARTLMREHQVPVVPGTLGLISTVEEALQAAEEIGYPIMIKASAGGGGKGMRKAFSPEELKTAFETAKGEAKAAFNDDRMYLEKLILNPHHIEFQILGDRSGNIIYLGERDCSIQKNNQKLLEESPSRVLTEEKRRQMGADAVKAAKACGYNSAGTVEFVLDESGNHYFIEMNTRIQVEHPVTEMITGIDLVREQIRVAAGMKLGITQNEVSLAGHAIECRINAACPGEITSLHFPAGFGIRVESHLYQGYRVSPFYDSMVAKIIATGNTRLDAIRRMRRALEELIIDGIETNAEFMYLLTYHPEFIRGTYDTSFWEKHSDTIREWQEKGRKINADQ